MEHVGSTLCNSLLYSKLVPPLYQTDALSTTEYWRRKNKIYKHRRSRWEYTRLRKIEERTAVRGGVQQPTGVGMSITVLLRWFLLRGEGYTVCPNFARPAEFLWVLGCFWLFESIKFRIYHVVRQSQKSSLLYYEVKTSSKREDSSSSSYSSTPI